MEYNHGKSARSVGIGDVDADVDADIDADADADVELRHDTSVPSRDDSMCVCEWIVGSTKKRKISSTGV